MNYENFLDDRKAEISRAEALRYARLLRLAIIQQQFNAGNLTELQANELLKANLTPGDDSTFIDDSTQLVHD